MKFTKFILIAGLSAAVASCSKKEIEKEHDLYFDVNGMWGRFYYKNYQDISLKTTDPITGSMFVDGDDVYYPTVGGYLKNGNLVPLAGAEVITSVFVKDGEVYAAGSREPYGATYWHNGQMIKLSPDSSEYDANAYKIIVTDNNEIYVGGTVRDGAGSLGNVAFWRNGAVHRFEEGRFTDMAVSGGDVYIVGTIRNPQDEGVYWQNGQRHPLTDLNGNKPGFMTSVSVWDHNIYMTGGGSGALYWKNGQPVGEVDDGYSQGVVVNGGKLYVAANMVLPQSTGPQTRIILWKDGVPDTLGAGEILGIYLGN